jgi:hypothetical protein
MTIEQALDKLLELHAEQVKSPSIWADDTFKNKYYQLQNYILDSFSNMQKDCLLIGRNEVVSWIDEHSTMIYPLNAPAKINIPHELFTQKKREWGL